MGKPITVERMEFAEKIVKLVNESSLPAFVIRDVLNKTLEEVTKLEDAQYEHDKKRWEEEQAKNENKTDRE